MQEAVVGGVRRPHAVGQRALPGAGRAVASRQGAALPVLLGAGAAVRRRLHRHRLLQRLHRPRGRGRHLAHADAHPRGHLRDGQGGALLPQAAVLLPAGARPGRDGGRAAGPPRAGSARRWARRVTVWLSAYIYALILLWLPAPLLAGQWLLPVVQIHGVDWSRRPAAYGALYALQCAVLLTQVPVVIGLDCFFVAAMLHVGALLRLLGRRVCGLRLSGDGPKGRQLLYAELCACIRSHQKITKFLRDLESAMSAMVLVQLSSTMVGLCMTLYQQTQGEALSLSAYSSQWVGCGAAFQRSLCILMARAHQPLAITAGRIYPINTAAFVALMLQLMKASYSYYTLLRQLDD